MSDGCAEPRVLHVNTARTWRGGEQQMVYLLRGLRERGVRSEAVCRAGSPVVERARRAGAAVNEMPVRTEVDPAGALRIALLARRGRFNILHAHTAHAHSLVLMAARLLRAGCRVVVHRRSEFPPGRGPLGLGKLKYRHGVDAFIAISNRMKEILVEAGVAPWRVFPVRSVTDPGRFSASEAEGHLRDGLGIPRGAFVVGNVAYLVGHKDHGNLLEAARIAVDDIPDLWVVIVGTGPLLEEIIHRAEALGIGDRLVMTGFRDDVPQLLGMFDVFALSSSQEGICSSVLDAMAAGCPVVATDAAGVREAVLDGETGIIVPIRDPKALAAGIVRMTASPEMARRMAEAGRQRARRLFTVEALTEKTLSVYGRVLAGQVGPEFAIPPEP